MFLHLASILQNCIYALHKCHHKNVPGISSCFEFSIFNKGMFKIVFTFSWMASQASRVSPVTPLSKINWAVTGAAPERGEAGRSGPETGTEAGQSTPGHSEHRPHSDLSQGIMKLSTVWSALTSANQTNKTFSAQSLRRELYFVHQKKKNHPTHFKF